MGEVQFKCYDLSVMNDLKLGIYQSRIISNEVVDSSKEIFRSILDINTHSLISWGSVSRREMGPSSDLDFLIVSKSPDLQGIKNFSQEMEKKYPNHNLDLIPFHKDHELLRLSCIDGTSNSSYLFNKSEIGKSDFNHNRRAIDQNQRIRIVLNQLLLLEFSYPKLYSDNNLKFSKGCLKTFNFAFTIVSCIINEQVEDTSAALIYLNKIGFITSDELDESISAFEDLLFLRNSLHNLTGNNILNNDAKLQLCTIFFAKMEHINSMFTQLQSKTIKLNDRLNTIAIGYLETVLDKEIISILKNTLIDPKYISHKQATKLIETNNETVMLILGFILEDPSLLEKIRAKNLTNWYILYSIANNKNTAEETFMRLMVPSKEEEKQVKNLYTDFSWRNIYLYIAKNPSSSRKIKDYIFNYPHARKMDKEAAIIET